ncbi:hypothetical protein [Bacillus sp. S/N-304-OC-R1]|uniref:hypothetical protein n=1 Tax=Bacillus sp. S/N-304-OC-R1 TaxID=2758034 RepID=UPI001C8CF427|nr:hypothetical protein [Bacillus sp. S/N-304-OC-R1]MBY0120363.1 hypothetical protein [Bacillus sp. S/N-304-OC-R1]
MEQEKSIPDFTQMDHQMNDAAYTTESIVSDSQLDLNIYTEEQNTVEVVNPKNSYED